MKPTKETKPFATGQVRAGARPSEGESKPLKPRTELYKGKILIIDDEPSAGERLGKWLARTSYRYTFVHSEDEASALLEHESFDAIVYSSEFSFPRRGFSSSRIASQRLLDIGD